jgi:thioredoxin reductase (NADPH)
MDKPIILAVDTERKISDALERDLPKRYGSDYTILVERSPTTALEHVRHLQGTNGEVALLITGLWLSEMSGIDFLIHAHQFAPDAKRLILMAYGDTAANDAANDAANNATASAMTLGQFESLVTKPWASPEEHLYPAIGELLSEWARGHLPCFEMVRVVGSEWSADIYRLRDLLERNPAPYGFYDEDSPEGRQLLADFRLDATKLPAALLFNGRILQQPSPVALAAALGAPLHALPQLHDVAIVGAGQAGLAAAVYGVSEGLATVAIEAEAVGGQAGASAALPALVPCGRPTGLGADHGPPPAQSHQRPAPEGRHLPVDRPGRGSARAQCAVPADGEVSSPDRGVRLFQRQLPDLGTHRADRVGPVI